MKICALSKAKQKIIPILKNLTEQKILKFRIIDVFQIFRQILFYKQDKVAPSFWRRRLAVQIPAGAKVLSTFCLSSGFDHVLPFQEKVICINSFLSGWYLVDIIV